MRKLVFCVFLALSTWACSSKQSPEQNTDAPVGNAEDFLCEPYKRFGKILPTHSYQDIEQMFGKENLGIDSVYAEGVFVSLQTVVFKDKPEEFFIAWQEDAPPFKKIISVATQNPQSPYRTADGIGAGSSLKDLVKANGGNALTFSGFGWDFGGSCCGGLDKKFMGLNFTLDLTDTDIDIEESESIYGDQEVSSDNPLFEKYNVRVARMDVSLNNYSVEG